ncbi:peptidase A24 [Marinomonas sp. CT5]|uniref:pepsin-like aspartic protease n=1 Tax=Marinomonas sp. CT5 TaxID=2066133 RepID=UPI001BB088B7|nr:pepsin-like aspartic protease [Marinomonas sp. CT5]QUX95356.1 peptidase A24 [Marinomonas sp. CT5]
MKKNLSMNGEATGISITLDRGPYQNNGASPWYACVGLGTSPQPLKFSFDTGSNFIWVTSSLCKPNTCEHYGDKQFVYQLSSSFTWVDEQVMAVSFGPWGSMEVQTGRDVFTLTPHLNQSDIGSVSVLSDIYLAKSYEGPQFSELDWDGGIGVPSMTDVTETAAYSPYRYQSFANQAEAASFHFFQSLIEQRIVSPQCPYVGFLTDIDSKAGQVQFGQLDDDYRNSREYLFLPWDQYAAPYLWTSKIFSLSIGHKQVISPESLQQEPYFFALDSGSSAFKGDVTLMNTLYNIASQTKEDVVIEIGRTDAGDVGKLVVTADMYNVFIEEGEDKGKVITQFQPLEGGDYIALVGSVMMDYLYTVYEYSIHYIDGKPNLLPVGMWVFNKPSGPRVITTLQELPARIFDVN